MSLFVSVFLDRQAGRTPWLGRIWQNREWQERKRVGRTTWLGKIWQGTAGQDRAGRTRWQDRTGPGRKMNPGLQGRVG